MDRVKYFIFIFFLLFVCCYAQNNNSNSTSDFIVNEEFDPDKEVEVIIQFKSPPLSFLNNSEGQLLPKQVNALSVLQYEHNNFLLNLKKIDAVQSGNIINFDNSTKILNEYFIAINGVCVKTSYKKLIAISKLPEVYSIKPNNTYEVTSLQTQSVKNSNTLETLTGFTGEGILIAVIDTGIDYYHPDLGSGMGPNFKIVGGKDFGDNDNDPMDVHGHGTHVAGIIAANGQIRGIAPDSKLLAVKVMDRNGFIWENKLVQAIEYALDPNGDFNLNDKASIINISLGNCRDEQSPGTVAVNNAVNAGSLVVLSAGNFGPNYFTVGSPANSKYALTVGNCYPAGFINNTSSRGVTLPSLILKPEVIAPGTEINSCSLNSGYKTLSGTSMSAPYVAGMAALLLQKYPDMSVEELKSVIINCADDRNYDIWTQGNGQVNIQNSLNKEFIVSPATLSFSVKESTPISQTFTDTLIVKNISDNNQTFSIQYTGEMSSGFTVNFSERNFDLPSKSSKSIIITVNVNTSNLLLKSNFPSAFLGKVEVRNSTNITNVPFNLNRGSYLKINFTQGWYTLILHDRVNYSKSAASPGGNFVYEQGYSVLPTVPGKYDLMGELIFSEQYKYGYFVLTDMDLNGWEEITIDTTVFKYNIENQIFDRSNKKLQIERGTTVFGHKTAPFGFVHSGPGKNIYYFNDIPDSYLLEYQHIYSDYDKNEFYYTNKSFLNGISKSESIQEFSNNYKVIDSHFNPSDLSADYWTVNRLIGPTIYHLPVSDYTSNQYPYRPIIRSPFNQTFYLNPISYRDFGEAGCGGFRAYIKNLFYEKKNNLFDGDYFAINEKLIGESAYYLVNSKDSLFFFPHQSGYDKQKKEFKTIFKYTGSTINQMLGPPHFYGKLEINQNKLTINNLTLDNDGSQLTDQLFFYQFHDKSLYNNLYAYLYKDKNLIDSILISSSDFRAGRTINYSQQLTGINELLIPFNKYHIQGTPGNAAIKFIFDINKADKSPPFIPLVQIYQGKEIVNFIEDLRGAEVRFRALDEGQVKSISMQVKNPGSEWQNVIVTSQEAINDFVGRLDNIDLQKGFISLRIIVVDVNDNSIEYLAEPAIKYGYTLLQSSPSNLQASSGNNKIFLSWNDNTVSEFGFIIERSYNNSSFAAFDTVVSNITSYVDSTVSTGNYKYRIMAYNASEKSYYSNEISINFVTGIGEDSLIPDHFCLFQNFPNPFNPVTVIKYSLPVESNVIISVFNILGEQVIQLVNENKKNGFYTVEWNASNLSSGVYFYRIMAVPNNGAQVYKQINKMILLK